jgi:hypothetical protein
MIEQDLVMAASKTPKSKKPRQPRESAIRVECVGGCGKFQLMRQSKIRPSWQYIGCGRCDGWRALEDSLRQVRQGLVLEHTFDVAGGFRGMRLRIRTEEERNAIGRAQALRAMALDPRLAGRAKQQEERRAAMQAALAAMPVLPRTSLISTSVIEQLGCSLVELNRWASDGRLPADGKRSTLLGGGYTKWLRAWLPETIEGARPALASWREQDKIRKAFARRGPRLVVS